MKFRIKIHKDGAANETRVIDAPSRFAVYDQVEHEGGTVVELTEQKGMSFSKLGSISLFGSGVKRIEIVHFAKDLSAMLKAGLSLSRAFSVIGRQSSNKFFKNIVDSLEGAIQKGSSFHEALAAYPKVFPGIFVAMVRAGEESGSLVESLKVIGLQMERAEELSRKVRGAMIYPIIIIIAIIIVAVLMLIYVVPTLTDTFTELGVEVPLATRVIIVISDFLSANALLSLSLLGAFFIGVVTFVRSEIGRVAVLKVAIHAPVIGNLVRETYAARTARTLASLLAASVPVLDALSITKDVVHARTFSYVIEDAEVRVKKGEPLSAAFIEEGVPYPILLGDMLTVGEETGEVTEMLKQIAEFYEQDVAEGTKDLSTIIEPVLMLLIGGVVGVFAVAMITPIYSLSSAF